MVNKCSKRGILTLAVAETDQQGKDNLVCSRTMLEVTVLAMRMPVFGRRERIVGQACAIDFLSVVVCLSSIVCLSPTFVYCGQTRQPIKMPFVTVTHVVSETLLNGEGAKSPPLRGS